MRLLKEIADHGGFGGIPERGYYLRNYLKLQNLEDRADINSEDYARSTGYPGIFGKFGRGGGKKQMPDGRFGGKFF